MVSLRTALLLVGILALADASQPQSKSLRGQANNGAAMTEEDKAFWDRLLSEVDSSLEPEPIPTKAPAPGPTIPAATGKPTTTAPDPTLSPAVATPDPTVALTKAPTVCPTVSAATKPPTASSPTGQPTMEATTVPPTTNAPTASSTEAATECGPNTCNEGEICCNESCGICVPGNPGDPVVCTTEFCGFACGEYECPLGTECCNESCGTCVKPGETCDKQQICNPRDCPAAEGACTADNDPVKCDDKCTYGSQSCADLAGYSSSQCCKQPKDVSSCTMEIAPLACSQAGCIYDNACIATLAGFDPSSCVKLPPPPGPTTMAPTPSSTEAATTVSPTTDQPTPGSTGSVSPTNPPSVSSTVVGTASTPTLLPVATNPPSASSTTAGTNPPSTTDLPTVFSAGPSHASSASATDPPTTTYLPTGSSSAAATSPPSASFSEGPAGSYSISPSTTYLPTGSSSAAATNPPSASSSAAATDPSETALPTVPPSSVPSTTSDRDPTSDPTTSGATGAPSQSTGTGTAVPTVTFVRPDLCPARVRTSCATVEGNIPCVDIPLPDPAAGEDCIVPVQFTYNMTNLGEDTRQIYALTVLRNDIFIVVTNLAGDVPLVILEPGETYITQGDIQDKDLCTEKGIDIFDARVQVDGGIPAYDKETVTCTSDEGQPCDEIVQDPDSENCALNVSYIYTVENVAETDFSIRAFNRTRNGETISLMPALGDNIFVPMGETVSVPETVEINRCEPLPSFATNTTVRGIPPISELCRDTYYYPIGLLPDEYK